MSSFKRFKRSDIISSPYVVNKDWEFEYCPYPVNDTYIKIFKGTKLTSSFSLKNDPVTEGQYERLIYDQINHLYYQQYGQESLLLNTGSLMSSLYYESASEERNTKAYFNYNENPNVIKYFPTGNNEGIRILSISKDLYSNQLLPHNFELSSSVYFIKDDGIGNLIDFKNNNTHVGNIFYSQGISIITNQEYQLLFPLPPLASYKIVTFYDTDVNRLIDLTDSIDGRGGEVDYNSLELLDTLDRDLFTNNNNGSVNFDDNITQSGLYQANFTFEAVLSDSSCDNILSNIGLLDVNIIPNCDFNISFNEHIYIPPPSPTPSITPSITPTRSVTPTITITPTPSLSSGSIPTPTPSRTVTPTPTPSTLPGGVVSGSQFISFPAETSDNIITWENIPELIDNTFLPKMYNVGGFGAPTWYNDPTGPSNKHASLTKGWTHWFNLRALPKNNTNPVTYKYDLDELYTFEHPHGLIVRAANRIKGSINSGPDQATKEYLANQIGWNYYNMWKLDDLINNNGLNIKNLDENERYIIGKYCFYAMSNGQTLEESGTSSYSVDQSKMWIMLDDEHMSNEGGLMNFFGIMNKAISDVAPNTKRAWYAKPNCYFYIEYYHQNPENISNAMIEAELKGLQAYDPYILQSDGSTISGVRQFGNMEYNNSNFIDSGFYIDSGTYLKVPQISSHDKYVKLNGSFVLDGNGKRIFNKNNFTETIWGQEVEILGEPSEFIKYGAKNPNTGVFRYGAQYFDISPDGQSATLKYELSSQGFEVISSPNASSWVPETYLYIYNIYIYCNSIMLNLNALSRLEYNNTDISRWRDNAKCLAYTEFRLATEPFTSFGNSSVKRNIGSGVSQFLLTFALLSGCRAISLWEDGHIMGHGLKNRGEVAWLLPDENNVPPQSYNWTGLVDRTSVTHTLRRDLYDTNQNNWRYIHFYFPTVSQKSLAPICSGIYTGDRFVFVIADPNLNYDESRMCTLTINSVNHIFNIKDCHEFLYRRINGLSSGLDGNDFILTYTNIYGNVIQCRGVMNGTISDWLV